METLTLNNTEVIDSTKKLLADLHLQYQNLRNFHWNVKGPQFFVLHEKFEELYLDVASKIDETAERILSIGGSPSASIVDNTTRADIEDGYQIREASEMVAALIKGYDVIINDVMIILKVADEAGDEGTADTFTGYVTELQKTNWMLKAYLGQ